MNRIDELPSYWARQTPDQIAIVDYDKTVYSYQTSDSVIKSASVFLEKIGVRAGDRIMLVGENSFEFATFVFALSRLDAWIIPVNARNAKEEILKVRKHATARAVIFLEKASKAASSHAETLNAQKFTEAGLTLRALVDNSTIAEACFEDGREQVAAMFYTTGTTGDPKGVMLTHENLLYSSRVSMEVRDILPEDQVLSVVPMTHIFGFSSAFLAGIRAGATVRFLPRFDPALVFEAMKEGVSIMPAVPQMYALLMRYAEDQGLKKPPASKLKYISAGGAPLDIDWKKRCEDFFGLTLHNGYGMTEASPGICATKVGFERNDTACGPPLPGQEIRLMPSHGHDDLQDGIGEIHAKGPNIMKGYYRNPQATSAALDKDGWLKTGDLGKFTDDGALMIVGRSKELIIRSGFNIYPPEVEAALTQHPDIAISAVVGRKQNDGNEEVIAFIQPVTDAIIDTAQLKNHLSDLLAPYKHPNRYVFAKALPAAATGKILKHTLIAHFAKELAD